MKKFIKASTCFFVITNFVLILLFSYFSAKAAVGCSAMDYTCDQYCGLSVNCEGGSCFCGAGDGCACYGDCPGGGSFWGGKDCDGTGWGDHWGEPN